MDVNAVYTIVAGILAREVVQGLKWALGYLGLISWPTWVKQLVPLWKLVLALGVAIVIFVLADEIGVALGNPLVILVVAQVFHEFRNAATKARAGGEEG